MKLSEILIGFIAIILVLTVGCSYGFKNKENKIVFEQLVGETAHGEIKDSKEVQKVKDILDNICWENAKVNMSHPPEYTFYFEDTKEKQKTTDVIYDLWISPNRDKVELVIESQSKYVQLDKEKSAELFKIIMGKSLSEV